MYRYTNNIYMHVNSYFIVVFNVRVIHVLHLMLKGVVNLIIFLSKKPHYHFEKFQCLYRKSLKDVMLCMYKFKKEFN